MNIINIRLNKIELSFETELQHPRKQSLGQFTPLMSSPKTASILRINKAQKWA
ncbi:unnamed protein product [Dovyalis caffra]|uniref:Uncharacterized protein n=1 Tax=Dovyalis caffra TaxID=77055 RepID=A0AAV1RNF9_9ROSI|nr:unnamed protein product [Dovyalis caffra]